MRKLLTILLFLSILTLSYAWNDCPFGKVNDPYPGMCRMYIDTNHDGICDHSEPPPTIVNKFVNMSYKDLESYNIEEICKLYKIDPKSLKEKLKINVPNNTSLKYIVKNYHISPIFIKVAIAECIIEKNKNSSNKNSSWIDKIVSFLFSTINLKDILFRWL
ncbi:hypothetical protein [Methanocaldococcus sp.]